jgi:hypothetical protein
VSRKTPSRLAAAVIVSSSVLLVAAGDAGVRATPVSARAAAASAAAAAARGQWGAGGTAARGSWRRLLRGVRGLALGEQALDGDQLDEPPAGDGADRAQLARVDQLPYPRGRQA